LIAVVSGLKVAVVGGGINGIMTALTLSRAGCLVDLYDKGMLGAETSAKSSKLLHGGLRYLESLHLRLVYEGLRCRAKWIEKFPQYTKVVTFYVPIYRGDARSKWLVFLGAKLYQLLAGFRSLGASRLVSRNHMYERFPNLSRDGLLGGVSYADVIMDDKSIIAALRDELLGQGVAIHENSYVQIKDTKGVLVTEGGKVQYSCVVNATGPWAGATIGNVDRLRYVRGSHLLISPIVSDDALVLTSREGRRIIFLLPFSELNVFGTTEVLQKSPDNEGVSEAELQYLTRQFGEYFQGLSLNVEDAYSGVRPIYDDNEQFSAASRDCVIEKNERTVTIFGGKWTSSLEIGEKVLKIIRKGL
jgi:glycerol-3-phosphate dehydrogenase